MRALALLALVACSDTVSTRCDDGAYCPARTVCGAAGACLVANGECETFVDLTPCLHDGLEQGHCKAGVCVDGVELLGVTLLAPGDIPIAGVPVRALGRPEVLPVETNLNGFFGLIVPPAADIIIEIRYEDRLDVVSRLVQTGDQTAVPIDLIYGGIPLIPRALAEATAEQVGTTIMPGRAMITGVAYSGQTGGSIAGSAVKVSNPSCVGPLYPDREGQVIPGATATTDAGVFIFFNCDPGGALLEVEFAGEACRVLDVEADRILVEGFADRLTFVGRVVCE
jgi:hypothetical protein